MSLIDIDECAEGLEQCAQGCHNTIGSYTCSCNASYVLNSDGRGCDGKVKSEWDIKQL